MTEAEIDAMEAGPEMDALVAEKVMGWLCVIDKDGEEDFFDKYVMSFPAFVKWGAGGTGLYRIDDLTSELWSPSTDIKAAWEAVEKFKDTSHSLIIEYEKHVPQWRVNSGEDYSGQVLDASADTAPLAICRAALKSFAGKT